MMRKRPNARLFAKGFTLLEILVGLTVFGFVMAAASGVFLGIYRDWQKQRDDILYLENARWALEFMTKEIRRAGAATIDINNSQKQMTFNISRDFSTGNRKVQYHAPSPSIRRREADSGPGWGSSQWQTLAEKHIPPGSWDVFILNGSLLNIEITSGSQDSGRSFYFRTKVRPRN